ncbi:MAG: dienelactone hydrolase family protein [Dehalococcoidia bacterium]|nr:dienelactone hydrolase family protein [Dehalococcoidia bacterium]
MSEERVSPQGALAHLAIPAGGEGQPVLVLHSWWGLTAAFTGFARQLASRGFVVGCADLYGGRTARTEAEARALRARPRREPMYRTLQRCLRELADHPGATRPATATVGFSMGGHWAVWLAQHPPPEISGTVLYYAVHGGDFSQSNTPFLGHFAETDAFVSSTARRSMERAIAGRGLEYRSYDYPGTGHWFAESDQPSFHRPSAELAFERTVSFLKAL